MSTAKRIRSWLACSALLGLLSDCALTSKADAVYPRFFSPEPEMAAAAPPVTTGPPIALRLGQVEAASHIDERFAYRLEPSELSYYEERRWTEAPERYLRRALERELFQRRGIQRIVSGLGNTLDVELTAFEELRSSPARVRVALSFSLHDDRQSQLERSLVVERPLPANVHAASAREVTAALTLALQAAVLEVSQQVTRELQTPASEPSANAEH